MATDPAPTSPENIQSSGSGAVVRLAWVAAALMLGALIGGFAIWRVGSSAESNASTIVVRDTAAVVTAMRDLARLETAEAHVERVIDLRDVQRHLWGLVEAEDVILLVAAGDVRAGVDLTKLTGGDVIVDEVSRSVTITLPPAEVFHTALDLDHTFVHSRTTDVLARRQTDLETRARREAERSIEMAALDTGLLDRARDNAETVLRTLVHSLGFNSVEIRWRSE